MPAFATLSRLAIQASISGLAVPPVRFTASGIGILSTTDQASGVRPGGVVSIMSRRASTASRVQTSPIGISCSAETTSVAPTCRTSSSVTLAFGPNHLHP